MITITSIEYQENIEKYNEIATGEPVSIKQIEQPDLVLITESEYRRMKNAEKSKNIPLSEERKNLLRERMKKHERTYERLAK